MMGMSADALGALLRIDLRRLLLPTARGLILPALFVAWGALRSPPDPQRIVFGLVIAIVMAPILATSRVGFDRADGTLAYLASLPVSGELLASVRILSSIVVMVLVCIVVAVTALVLLPNIPSAIVLRSVVIAAGFALVLGSLPIGPLARIRGTTLVTWIFGVWLAAGALLDLTGWGDQLGEALGEFFQRTSLPTSIVLIVGVAWAAFAVLAVGAFYLAARGLQPNGGAPTERAIAALQRYQREETQ